MSNETRVRSFVSAKHNDQGLSEAASRTLSETHYAFQRDAERRKRLVGDFITTLNIQAISTKREGEIQVVLADTTIGYIMKQDVEGAVGEEGYNIYTVATSTQKNKYHFSNMADAISFLVYAVLKNIAR